MKKKKKKKKGLSKEKVRVRWGSVGNNKKNVREIIILKKKVCIIDKLMWVFCKSDSVK